MRIKANFEETKKAVAAIGKAVKKGPSVIPDLVKIEAKGDSVTFGLSGTVDVSVKVPAEIKEEGVFVTSFSSLNILSLRKCSGDIKMSTEGDNTLLLKYKGSKASTELTAVDYTFNEMVEPAENAQKVSISVDALKDMTKTTIFATDDIVSSKMHSLRLIVADDEDGIMKFSITACDGKTIAMRTAYFVKNGDYTGQTILLPENLKTAISIIDGMNGAEENVELVMDGDKVYLMYEDMKVCLKTLDVAIPNYDGIIAARKETNFGFKVDRAEMLEAINCAIYIMQDVKEKGATEKMMLGMSANEINVGCSNVSSYGETIDAETDGELPVNMAFDPRLFKEVVSNYPIDTLEFRGSGVRAPLWLCFGENDEYIYCIMPMSTGK